MGSGSVPAEMWSLETDVLVLRSCTPCRRGGNDRSWRRWRGIGCGAGDEGVCGWRGEGVLGDDDECHDGAAAWEVNGFTIVIHFPN